MRNDVSASRSRRLQIVPVIQSFAQLEKNYGKEGAEIIVDNTQLASSVALRLSSSAEVLSKALGSRTSCPDRSAGGRMIRPNPCR